MAHSSLVLFEEESQAITEIIEKLLRETNGKSVFLVDKDGQLISSSGETNQIDSTSLASLTAGNIAATGGLAKLIGEKEFSILFHEGERDNIHISIVGQRVILVVIFDEKSSLGLVRLRVRKTTSELEKIVSRILDKMKTEQSDEHLLEEITDDDIDNLFHE